jgi:hypothetical protein
MIVLDTFDLVDAYGWTKREVLREAMNCAKRHAEMMWYLPRCVVLKGQKVEGEDTISNIEVWGHILEIPEEMKHWTERLNEHQGNLTAVWEGE